eukprot:4831484-Alexandrium_andersonii.AAC.1
MPGSRYWSQERGLAGGERSSSLSAWEGALQSAPPPGTVSAESLADAYPDADAEEDAERRGLPPRPSAM